MNSNHQKKDSLLEARYGKSQIPENIIWNPTIEALMAHRSIRNYLPDALPKGCIETMIAAAQSASVSGNLQQWSVMAITDQKLKAQIAALSRKAEGAEGNHYIEQAPALLLWVADLSRNNDIAKVAGGKAEMHQYLDSFLMASIDTALAAQNAAIAAESMGLGIVFIGAMRNQAQSLAELLSLPKMSYVVFGMVVGKPELRISTNIRPRLSQKVVLHYNGYDHSPKTQAIETYESYFKSFREQSAMKEKTWKDTVYNRGRQHYLYGWKRKPEKSRYSSGF